MESERSGWYRKIVDGEQNHREKSPLLIDQRVIWFDDDGCEHGGYVRWIGKLQEMGDDWIAGVELDEPAGKNDGAWGSLRLFSTRPNHGLIINVNALMKEEEYVDESSFNDNFYLPKTDLVDCRPKISTDTRRKIESSREKMEYDEQFSFPSSRCMPTKQVRKHRKHCPLPSDVTLMNDRNAVEINKLLVQLELAISNGLVEQASQLARKLASIKVKCSVVRKKSSPPASYKNISINLFVEDRTSHIGPITLDINPLMTIGQLKKKIEGEFQFPASLQRWIIGKKLASNDNASISSFDITSSGCPVFLYLTVDDASVTDMYKQKLETYLRALDDFDNGSGDSGTGNDDCSPEYFDCVEGDANERNSYYGLPLKQPTSTSEIVETKQEGWTCPSCTLINVPTRPGCSACGVARPEDYVIPAEYKLNDEEERRLQLEKEMDEAYRIELDKYKVENYQRLVDLDNVDVVLNDEKFECVVCFCEVDIGEGVRIRECLHTFCRDCIARTIEHSETAEVKCPYRDDNYSCPATMQDREIRALVTKEVYERHLQKSIAAAENQADNSFHCKTANCAGWCFYEDENNVFNCPVCLHNNCLTCQAIHEELNCKQYQDKLEYEATTNENAKKTKDALDTMLNRGEAMRCPKCQVIIMKKWGCDWLCCTMCRTEICWVTKGPRWGPAGKGDTNGGCRCGVTGVRCHPQCNYCH